MSTRGNGNSKERFRLYLIKPSHYDDDGYIIQWYWTDIPSNTMAVLHGVALDCIEQRVLGDEVEIHITALDECNTRIRPEKIIAEIKQSGNKSLIALVGVQSNQFPRAIDIARPFRAAGIPVCVGGFHTSGSLAMLPQTPPEIQEAWDLGISIFAGEVEGHFHTVLSDAYHGELRPLYDVMSNLPNLENVCLPNMPKSLIGKSMSARGSFDAGRGCPFQCSFCTIINVQGRRSRHRTADDIEEILRQHHARGVKKFFITDDNFARNSNWEAIFDRIIELRNNEGLKFNFFIQVDTLCHKITNFIEKAGAAGVDRVFIGLENINPDNLIAANKKQNRISEYRTMLQAWKSIGVITSCGYIIGFPHDTRERVLRDIEIIKRELPMDLIAFFCLTPLPGSEDHKVLDARNVPMDPDMNNYDTEHVTTAHPLMSKDEFMETYRQAWHAFYTPKHVGTILKRAVACGVKPHLMMRKMLFYYGCQAIENIHPFQGGLLRRKYRKDRRQDRSLENPLVFYGKHAWETFVKCCRFALMMGRYQWILRCVERELREKTYTDLALTPVNDDDIHTLEIFTVNKAASAQAQN
ncbi:MAG: radical SAM protein [Proteobacteria bacterium]|nr:radical SAM protein [Pseudomonadota bacterium]